MLGVNARMGDTDAKLMRQAIRLVARVDERYATRAVGMRHVRCHELARAVGRMLKLKTVDGVVVCTDGISEHSWLLTPKGNILDVYAVERLPMVQLVISHRVDVFCLYKPMEGIPKDPPVSRKMIRLLVKMMKGEKLPALPPAPRRKRATRLKRKWVGR